MTLAITRLDLTAEDLRRAARSSQDVAQARRCLAIASVLDGGTRTAAAESAGMRRQTLRDWVHRYNAEGVAGLLNRPRPVRPGLLSAAQRAEFDRIVEAGPDVAVDGVVRWRRVDLKRVVERRFGVVMAERTIGDLLHARGFGHVSVRPRQPDQNAARRHAAPRLRASSTRGRDRTSHAPGREGAVSMHYAVTWVSFAAMNAELEA